LNGIETRGTVAMMLIAVANLFRAAVTLDVQLELLSSLKNKKV
jgi:hypothetical protein